MLNTIIQEIITLTNGDHLDSATAALVLFVLVAFLFFGLLTIVHFVYLCIFKCHYTTFLTSFVQTIGALLYFYGDNISNLLNKYSTVLNCDEECVNNNRRAASFCLGVALIIFQMVPFISKQFLKVLKRKEKLNLTTTKKSPDWFSAIDMITIFVKLDTLYSAIVVMVQSREFCNRSDITSSSAFLAVCVLTGIFAEVSYFLYALTSNEYSERVFTGLVTIGLIVLVCCLPLYLLADNRQPLDCAFGCDTYAANTTANALACNRTSNGSVRLGFTALSFIVISVFSLVFFVCDRTAQEEESYPNSPRENSTKEEIEFSQFNEIPHTPIKTL